MKTKEQKQTTAFFETMYQHQENIENLSSELLEIKEELEIQKNINKILEKENLVIKAKYKKVDNELSDIRYNYNNMEIIYKQSKNNAKDYYEKMVKFKDDYNHSANSEHKLKNELKELRKKVDNMGKLNIDISKIYDNDILIENPLYKSLVDVNKGLVKENKDLNSEIQKYKLRNNNIIYLTMYFTLFYIYNKLIKPKILKIDNHVNKNNNRFQNENNVDSPGIIDEKIPEIRTNQNKDNFTYLDNSLDYVEKENLNNENNFQCNNFDDNSKNTVIISTKRGPYKKKTKLENNKIIEKVIHNLINQDIPDDKSTKTPKEKDKKKLYKVMLKNNRDQIFNYLSFYKLYVKGRLKPYEYENIIKNIERFDSNKSRHIKIMKIYQKLASYGILDSPLLIRYYTLEKIPEDKIEYFCNLLAIKYNERCDIENAKYEDVSEWDTEVEEDYRDIIENNTEND